MGDLFEQERVPVITLWQPWASLIFSGHKRFETRSFAPPFKYVGQRIAIHAAVKPIVEHRLDEPLWWLCRRVFGNEFPEDLPLGAVLGTALLGGFCPTERVGLIGPDELTAGDWSDGRYCWQLLDVRAASKPVSAKGKQGWWSIDAERLAA